MNKIYRRNQRVKTLLVSQFFGGVTRKRDYAGNWCDIGKIGLGDPESPTIDHVNPLSRGGMDALCNYIVCSERTNAQKGNSWPTWKVDGNTFFATFKDNRYHITRQNPEVVGFSGTSYAVEHDSVAIDSVVQTANGKTALIIFADGSVCKVPTKLSEKDKKKAYIYKMVYERIFGTLPIEISPNKTLINLTIQKMTKLEKVDKRASLRDSITGRFVKKPLRGLTNNEKEN
jgi:hypothetical protein